MARKKTVRDAIEEVNENDHPDDGGRLSPGPGRESFKLAQYWKSQVSDYDQASRKWIKKGNTVVKRFRDERNRIDEEGQRRMNLLWANIKVMKPAIYSRCPDPIVDRRFLDRDPIGRLSSQMLERTLRNELESSGYHNSIGMAVDDRLLPGKGVVWVRYVPEIGEGVSMPAATINGAEDPLFDIGEQTGDSSLTGETEEEEKLEQTQEQVIAEKIEVDYVDWRDFGYIPVKARTWAEVQAIYKTIHISKKEARERFGEKIGKALKPDTEPVVLGNTDRQTSDVAVFQDINERNITIYEIWNKSDKKAYWISTGYDYLCDVVEDPLELTGFFPIPPPLMATKTNDTLIPVPDFIEWQDLAIQIDELTQRIAMLSKACKVAGVYNAANTQINRIFGESIENELIPVDQWALFAESGGLKGAMDFVPLDTIQSAIQTLSEVRQQAMIDLDQITGLSDVIRGTSDSRETLGGLRLKNNNAGTRLSESQEDVARFARDTLKIMAEIVCKHFSDETIIESSGILYEDALQPDTIMNEIAAQQPPQPAQPPQMPPQQAPQQPPPGNVVPFPGAQQPPQVPQQPMPQMQAPQPPPPDPQVIIMTKVMKALELLRKDVQRGYRIDIETDSTIFGDKAQDRQDASEFLTSLGGYMKQIEGLANSPEAMPLFAKALQWGVRRFRTGRDLEAEIDSFCEAMRKKAKQMIDNPAPSPEQEKAQAEIKQMEAEGQMQQANDQRDADRQAKNDEREAAIAQQQNEMEKEKSIMEFQIAQRESENKLKMMEMEMELARERHAMELAKMRMEMQQNAQENAAEMHMKRMDVHQKAQEHELEVKSNKQELIQRKEEHKLDKKELDHKKKEQDMKHKEKMKPKPKKSA